MALSGYSSRNKKLKAEAKPKRAESEGLPRPDA
jgi:hypothetical protein